MIIWFTGRSKVGKTTLANMVGAKLDAIVIDRLFAYNESFGDYQEYTIRWIMRLAEQGYDVVMGVACQKKKWREMVNKAMKKRGHKLIWVWLKSEKRGKKYHQKFEEADLIIDTDKNTVQESIDKVLDFIK